MGHPTEQTELPAYLTPGIRIWKLWADRRFTEFDQIEVVRCVVDAPPTESRGAVQVVIFKSGLMLPRLTPKSETILLHGPDRVGPYRWPALTPKEAR